MTKKIRYTCVPSAYLVLVKEGKVLLMRRANTGYEDGNYGLPAGHVEEGETVSQACVREAYEEVDVVVEEGDLECIHTMYRHANDARADFFFTTTKWNGEPVNKEPHKCSELAWFPLENLPKNTVGYVRAALECYLRGEFYSENNW